MTQIFIARHRDEIRKSWSFDGDKPDSKSLVSGGEFDYEPRELNSLRDVFDLLSELVDDPHRAIVMGKPEHSRSERLGAYFAEQATDFWFIDLDGVPLSKGEEEPSAIERCLPFLAGHSYVYSFTSSAGINDGLRVRVVCQLDGGLESPDLQAHARHYNDLLTAFEGKTAQYIDSGIYSPSRLLFTSRPKLKDRPDPYLQRVFFVEGDETPITLEPLPKMVLIEREGAREKFDVLPQLQGTWGAGDGHGRSFNAWWGMRRLRTFMGAEFEDTTKRLEYWREMLHNAGAQAEDFHKYENYVIRKAAQAKPINKKQSILALPNPDRAVPLDVASERLENVLRNAIRSDEPRVVAVSVTMGTGKTHLALKHLAIQHRYLTGADDLSRYNPLAEFNIDYYVPTVQMGEEALQTAKEHGLEGFIEYGRGQIDPNSGPVCIKADAAKKIQAFVDSTAEHICRNKEERCEHHSVCRWQWQRNDTGAIPLRIRAHNYLPLTVRSEHHENYRPINFAVIDETSFVNDLAHNKKVGVKDLIKPRLEGDNYDWVLKFAKLINDGLTLEGLDAAGFTAEICKQLIDAETALRPSIDVTPRMTPEQSLNSLKDFNEHWHRYATVWRRLRECIEKRCMNRIHVVNREFIVLSWKSPIKGIPWDEETGRPKIPVLVMSGTMRKSIIEQFLPIDEWHEIDVQPHPDCEIIQSKLKGSKAECLYGSSELRRMLPEPGETDPDKIKNAERVRSYIKVASNGRTLITYKELEELLDHQRSGHFFAIEGLNEFSGDDVVIYGRPEPRLYEVEDLARAIFCDDPEPIKQIKRWWYPARYVARRGKAVGAGIADYHPDERVEDVRWMICEGEIMQAIARSRYVRQPVKISILNQTPLPLCIDRVVPIEWFHPDWRRFEETDVLPLSKTRPTQLWPGRWKHTRSAERWIKENKNDWADKHNAYLIEYRLRGQRGDASTALVKTIEAIPKLGDVIKWELVDHQQNDWAIYVHELADMLAREPFADEELTEYEVAHHDEPLVFNVDGREWETRRKKALWPWSSEN